MTASERTCDAADDLNRKVAAAITLVSPPGTFACGGQVNFFPTADETLALGLLPTHHTLPDTLLHTTQTLFTSDDVYKHRPLPPPKPYLLPFVPALEVKFVAGLYKLMNAGYPLIA
jgi:hypothetical protein